MRRLTFFLLLFILPLFMYAQRNIGGVPQTLSQGLESRNVDLIPLQEPNMVQVRLEDETNFDLGKAPRFGIKQLVNLNLIESGEVIDLDNGDRLRRLRIRSDNAKTLNFLFDHYYLAPGATLYIFRPDMKQVLGGFTSMNNKGQSLQDKRGFGTSLLQGDEAIIEIYEPASVIGESIINLQYVVHGYRMVTNHFDEGGSGAFGASGACQVNKNCPEGDDWQEQSRGVALILVNGNVWCSGTLLNNANEDCTPYFLTANHCTDDFGGAGTELDFTSFLWGYESPGCDNGVDITAPCTNGAVIRANGAHTDFSLLELDENPADEGIGVVFNGWTREAPGAGGALIHHPSGDIMKIGTIEQAFQVGTAADPIAPPQPGNYWFIDTWVATANGHSIPEGGSSGAGIFNRDGLLIAQHRRSGGSDCDDPTAEVGWFGRFDVSWDAVNNANSSLQPWLDPDNTGIMTMASSECVGCEGDLVYHFEDEDGNAQNEFCIGQDVYVDGSATIDTDHYFMDLWVVESGGGLDWISGAGWIPGTPDFVNISDLFENDPEHPVVFETGVTYMLKLAINHPDCGWVELLQPFTFYEPNSVDYHYENEDGIDQTEFCLGQDVYLNGSATLDTDHYFMDLWIVDGNGDYDWISGAGWTPGTPDFVNITNLFENDPEHPVTFEVGETYSVKLAINDPDCGWVELQHDFTIVEPDSVVYHYEDVNGNIRDEFCPGEDVFVNGSATLDTDHFFMDLWVVDGNGDYDWISGAGWMSGTPDLVNITELFENDPEHPVTFQIGVTYSVKLAINDPYCGWVELQHNFTIVECCNELSMPENLEIVDGMLSWDPVPGAIGYIVEAPRFWPIDCRCEHPISIASIGTDQTSIPLPEVGPFNCYVVQVRAICADGSSSEPSDWLCVGGKKGIKGPIIVDASITPNPTVGDMTFNVMTSEESSIQIEVMDFSGISITTFTLEASVEGTHSLEWNNNGLRAGVYFVQFRTGEESLVKQVVVQ